MLSTNTERLRLKVFIQRQTESEFAIRINIVALIQYLNCCFPVLFYAILNSFKCLSERSCFPLQLQPI